MEVTAAVLRKAGEPRPYSESQPLQLTRLELDPPQPGEVLVRVRAAGLCHSDLSTINGSRERPVPMAIGHEIAGEVIECGPGDADFDPGDKVVASFVPACGKCGGCAGGQPAMCEAGAAANADGSLLGGGRRLREPGGDQVHHHLGVSGFADHVVVSERSLVAIDDRVPWEIAALFGCAVLTGVGAVVNAAEVKLGDTVAVFGLGGVGLAAVLGAVAAGAERVAVVDPVAAKRELALELGATHAFDTGPAVVAEVRAALDGGAEHAIETAGIAAVLAQAFAATRRGGQTTTVGLPAPGVDLAIPAVQVTAEERTLRGSYLGSCVPRRDVPRFVAMYLAGRLPVDRLLSHRLAPEQLNEGFERLAAAEANRQVVIFD